MNFSIFLLLLGLCTIYGETIETPSGPQPVSDPQLTPTYTNPGANPSYTGNQPGPTYAGNNAYPTDVYPNYGYGEYAYQPYPVQKSETAQESGIYKTMSSILPVLSNWAPLRDITNQRPLVWLLLLLLVLKAFHVILKIVGKMSLFLLGGAALLVVGGAFTAAVCAVTPYCTLQFMGYGVSKEQVRSMLTPDRITIATNLVNEAIDKYQKLQGVVDSKNM